MMAFNDGQNAQLIDFIDSTKHWKDIRITEDRETLLHISILSRNYPMTEELLEREADPNLVNNDGSTALHVAVQLESKGCKFVDLILKYKANPCIKDSDGKTPLHLTRCNHCVKSILESNKKKGKGEHVVNIQDHQGLTPLMNLICHEKGQESIDIASSFLDCPHINLKIVSSDGNNSLHLAASFG